MGWGSGPGFDLGDELRGDVAANPLLPAALRMPAAVLLVACAGVTAVLGVGFADQGHGGWLDLVVDPRVRSSLAAVPALLSFLADTGQAIPTAVMTLALVLACVVTRRWPGAVLAAVAVPAAASLTDWVLKPAVGRTLHGALSFPSGHATVMFALAGTYTVLLLDPGNPGNPGNLPLDPGNPKRAPGIVRLLPVLLALLAATAVATAMVGKGAHYFTDVVGGAAVGTGMVLACAFAVDAASRPRRRRSPPPLRQEAPRQEAPRQKAPRQEAPRRTEGRSSLLPRRSPGSFRYR
jgi:membrane-associated phospholipid phosphatase